VILVTVFSNSFVISSQLGRYSEQLGTIS